MPTLFRTARWGLVFSRLTVSSVEPGVTGIPAAVAVSSVAVVSATRPEPMMNPVRWLPISVPPYLESGDRRFPIPTVLLARTLCRSSVTVLTECALLLRGLNIPEGLRHGVLTTPLMVREWMAGRTPSTVGSTAMPTPKVTSMVGAPQANSILSVSNTLTGGPTRSDGRPRATRGPG